VGPRSSRGDPRHLRGPHARGGQITTRGHPLAGDGEGGVEIGVATSVDFAAHERTYRGFLTLLKYSTAGIVLVLVLLAIFAY
jgi:hypothetical protein